MLIKKKLVSLRLLIAVGPDEIIPAKLSLNHVEISVNPIRSDPSSVGNVGKTL